MLKLKTIYPYGLNTNFNFHKFNNLEKRSIFQLYREYELSDLLATSMKFPRRGNRGKRSKRTKIDFVYYIDKIEKSSFQPGMVKIIKTLIFQLSFKKLKAFTRFLKEYSFSNNHTKDLVYDLIKYRLKSDVADFNTKSKNQGTTYLMFNFTHKVLDSIHLNKIINDKEILQTLPITSPPHFSIAYKYNKTLGRLLFNYNQIPFTTPEETFECI